VAYWRWTRSFGITYAEFVDLNLFCTEKHIFPQAVSWQLPRTSLAVGVEALPYPSKTSTDLSRLNMQRRTTPMFVRNHLHNFIAAIRSSANVACHVAVVIRRESWSAPRIIVSSRRSFCLRRVMFRPMPLIATISTVSERISLISSRSSKRGRNRTCRCFRSREQGHHGRYARNL
jgi:hypothetical protein